MEVLLIGVGAKVCLIRNTNLEKAPVSSDYTNIYSTSEAFAVLTHDGSIKAWGYSQYGGSGALSSSLILEQE
jgi:hypothetical protein